MAAFAPYYDIFLVFAGARSPNQIDDGKVSRLLANRKNPLIITNNSILFARIRIHIGDYSYGLAVISGCYSR